MAKYMSFDFSDGECHHYPVVVRINEDISVDVMKEIDKTTQDKMNEYVEREEYWDADDILVDEVMKEFSEKYVTYFTQPLDHNRPELGTFRQRVVVSHVGFDRPTVIVTEGYGASYALSPRYREELSRMFNTNMIFVEYRYFLESTPEPRD